METRLSSILTHLPTHCHKNAIDGVAFWLYVPRVYSFLVDGL